MKRRILAVEDSPPVRDILGLYLRETPFEIEFAGDGAEALRKIQSTGFDLILMDMQMPVLDGYQTVRLIRQWEEQHQKPEVPVLALSGFISEEQIGEALESGCTMHLSKPLRKEPLLQAIYKLLPRDGSAASTAAIDTGVWTELRQIAESSGWASLETLVFEFVADTQRRIERVQIALASNDRKTVKAESHVLKSTCANMGATGLSRMFKELEVMSAAKQMPAQPELLAEIRREWQRAEKELKTHIRVV